MPQDIFDIFRRLLGDISGGLVLDIATGEGGFIRILREYLKDYTEIVAIDMSGRALTSARRAFGPGDKRVRWLRMDVGRLGFGNESFDTVGIGVSLHHVADVSWVLAEAMRVLRPGGHFVVSEMYRDGQTEAQLTVVNMHHWAAEIDSALGVVHNRTLARQEIVDFVTALNLSNLMLYDHVEVDTDPKDEMWLRVGEAAIGRYVKRAARLPNFEAFRRRGEALRQRLHQVGTQSEPILIAIGEK
jgi:SAM-dependent methyltransferase